MFGFVLPRLRAHRLLPGAALVAVLLTTTVLTTLTGYADAVGDTGLRRALATRAAPAAALRVTAQLPADATAPADRAVRRGADRAFGGLPYGVRTLVRSGPYALPGGLAAPGVRPRRGGDPDLTQLAALDPSRVTFIAGTRPAAPSGGGPLQVALPEAAAARLGIAPGRRLTLTDRLSGPDLTIRVTGVWRPKNRTDPYWKLDELGGRGVRTLGFTTYGPLLTAPEAFHGGRVAQESAGWLVTGDFRTLTAGRLDALTDAARPAAKALMADPAFAGRATASTELPDTLRELRRTLLVNRSGVRIVALQLILLAGAALLLVAGALNGERATEGALLRARGGARRTLAAAALTEALLLALPAAVAAPLLAVPLLRLLASDGLPLDTAPTATTWATGAAVALGCALTLAAPALRTGAARPGRRRFAAPPGALRAGADLGLLVLAAVAYVQLRQHAADGGGVLTEDAAGRPLIDPVPVAAPALALLAGAVVTLRLLPLAARLAERAAAAGRGLTAALAAWQIGRRTTGATGPVLLLVLATALGMLAVGQRASWDRSQDDQADHRAGAAVRVLAGRAPQFGTGGALAATPGVAAALPAGQATLSLSDGHTATLLTLDTRAATGTLLLRGDLVGGSADAPPGRAADPVLRALAPAGGAPGVALPDRTARLRLTVALRSLRTLTAAPGAPAHDTGPVPADLTVQLTDGHGAPYPLTLGRVAADGRPHTLTADLTAAAGSGGAAVGPLRLTALTATLSQPPVAHRQQLTLTAARADLPDGTHHTLRPPHGLAWTGQLGTKSTYADQDFGPRAGAATVPPGALAAQTYDTGARPTDGYGAAVTTVRTLAAHPPRGPLPAVATDAYLRASGSTTGATVDVTVNEQPLRARIVRAVRALPGPADRPADGAGLLVDLGAVNEALTDRDAAPLPATEWWIRPAGGDAARAAAALRGRADTEPGQVLVRDETAAALHGDPLGRGPRAALTAATAVAVALAAAGFAVGCAAALRARAGEFAVLRALGASRRRRARAVVAEQGLLIAAATAVGAALGALLTHAVVPLIVLTEHAGRPVPPVLVELPAGQVALLIAAVVAVPLLTTAAVAARRGDTVRDLRGRGAL
ncbi:FtsX-like permease family protein [Streptomyces benahoarensis]|nr:FtsX-like permease family protein [Streptomyces benahoarensis]TSB22152.1 FtsX-like permease family protein [Streptomyces benahoarensis]